MTITEEELFEQLMDAKDEIRKLKSENERLSERIEELCRTIDDYRR